MNDETIVCISYDTIVYISSDTSICISEDTSGSISALASDSVNANTSACIVEQPVVLSENVLPGPPGPQGNPGIGSISKDTDNTITLGSDNGLFCSAVLNGIIHW
jgi:hypothetical protein